MILEKSQDAFLISGQSCTLVWMPSLKLKSWTDSLQVSLLSSLVAKDQIFSTMVKLTEKVVPFTFPQIPKGRKRLDLIWNDNKYQIKTIKRVWLETQDSKFLWGRDGTRSSPFIIPKVPDLFLLPNSLRNRFYHSSAPRGPRQIPLFQEFTTLWRINCSGKFTSWNFFHFS